MRQLQKPVSGIGTKPVAVRGSATSLANAKDFINEMNELGHVVKKSRNIR